MSSRFDRLWLFIVIFLLLTIACGGTVLAIKRSGHHAVEISLSPTTLTEYQGEIYIDGAVASPGFYAVKESDTIESLVQAAGPMPDADLSHIKIHVPETSGSHPAQRVDVNRAEVWLLNALPGIGQQKAQAIVDYRDRHGSFQRIEDLLEVEGIGSSTLERIRDLITVKD